MRSERSGMENLGEIYYGVASDRESELRLFAAGTFDADDGERAGVKNRGECTEPGLIVVLRAEIAEDWVRQMAFE